MLRPESLSHLWERSRPKAEGEGFWSSRTGLARMSRVTQALEERALFFGQRVGEHEAHSCVQIAEASPLCPLRLRSSLGVAAKMRHALAGEAEDLAALRASGDAQRK